MPSPRPPRFRPSGGKAASQGDEFRVVLVLALEPDALVVAATRAVGVFAAYRRSRLVHRAAALVLVEQHAGGLEHLVLLVAQQPHLFHRVVLGEALLGALVVQAEMPSEPLNVARRDLDLGIAAAVAG